MATSALCPVCGTTTDEAICLVDGTTLVDVLAIVAADEKPVEPVALEAPAPKKSRRKS